MRIAVLQYDIIWENILANWDKVYKLCNDLKADLIVLPEMFTTGFTMDNVSMAETMDGRSVERLTMLAKDKKALVMGSLMISDNGNVFNRLVAVSPEGDIRYYDKRHLFKYGQEDRNFSPGNERVILEYKNCKIAPLICYDLRFPCWSRYGDNYEFDLLIYVANWPAVRSEAWSGLLKARAIENQAYVVGCNRVGLDGNDRYHDGRSAVIDYAGRTLAEQLHREGVLTIDLEIPKLLKFRKSLPFLNDRDHIVVK